jgi:putative DNA primase/helicase
MIVDQQTVNALEQLKPYPCWVTWRRVYRNGKWTKIPYDPKTGSPADSTDRSTWSNYEQAAQVASNYDGLGFVFCDENPFSGIDLDDCIVNGKVES